ncbi:hypothetical protein [Cupriavidus basilensis]
MDYPAYFRPSMILYAILLAVFGLPFILFGSIALYISYLERKEPPRIRRFPG